MSFQSRPARMSLTLAAAALLVTACSTNDDPEAAEEESSPTSSAASEADVTVEPGLASCEFNNELDEHSGDGSGVSPYGELARAELREEADAYVVTFTGDFFDPEVLLDGDANGHMQMILSGEDYMAPSPTLTTEFRQGELTLSGTVVEQDWLELDTGAVIEDGVYTATYPKDSPQLEGFEPDMWAAAVYFDDGDESTYPYSFRCGDGRSWEWEPLA